MDYLAGLYNLHSTEPLHRDHLSSMIFPLEQEIAHHDRQKWNDKHLSLVWTKNSKIGDSLSYWLGDKIFVYVWGNVAHCESLAMRGMSNTYEDASNDIVHSLIEAYHAEGAAAFSQLTGSYFLLIYELKQKKLTIVSDHLASRPIFYTTLLDKFVFATDIRFVLSYPLVSRELDYRSVAEFLRFNMIFGERTLYNNVFMLPPATATVINDHGAYHHKYWTIRFTSHKANDCSINKFSRSLADVFVSAVDRITDNTGDIALMLSGGLDSRMIAAALQVLGKKPSIAITFGELENDEVVIAKRVAKEVGFRHHLLMRPSDYYTNLMQSSVTFSNGLYLPIHGHMFGLKKQIRELSVRTLLWGWGLDVPFSGSYLPKRSLSLFGREIPTLWLKRLDSSESVVNSILHMLGHQVDCLTANLMPPSHKELWLNWPRQVVTDLVDIARYFASDYHDQHDYCIVSNFSKFRSFHFTQSLRYCARERCVLFDKDLLDLFLAMPSRMRHRGLAYREALGRLNPKLLQIPVSSTNVPISYRGPVEDIAYFLRIINRSRRIKLLKAQYPEFPAVTMSSYPNADELLRERLMAALTETVLLDGKYLELSIIDPSTVRRMFSLHMTRQANYGNYLFAVMALSMWLEQWG